MSQEIELKLGLPADALPALRRHPLFASAPREGRTTTLDNTYFDTPDLALKARRVALRIRRQGRTLLQTVKCAAASAGGLTQRPEWEQRYADAFDYSQIDAPKVRRLLERHADALVPVFSTRFRRETRRFSGDEGVQVLMMLDLGEVIAGERRVPICELELELVAGTPLDLLRLACRLAEDLPLRPEDVSKAERGYRLHGAERPVASRGEPSAVEAAQTPLDAFRALAFSCLRQWQANAAGTAEGGGAEFVHQLRVALRRLRSLLSLFAPVLPDAFVAEWRERLAADADRFAAPRDLDVLVDELLAPVAAAADIPGLERLAAVMASARDAAHVAVTRAFDPALQGRLLLGFTTALYALPDADAGMPVREFARTRLERLRRQARRRSEAAADRVPARLHALRIALKRLRYGVEFFAPLLPDKAGARYLREVVRAQNALGFVNDLDVARGTLLAWAGDDGELRAAAGFVCGWHTPRAARLARRTLRELEPLLGGKTPWKR